MYKLLIADDELVECKAMEMLINANFDNIKIFPYVNNGVDLLQQIENLRPDIAIVDINMPGLTGLDAVEIIRMRNYNTKIIINTAYSEFEYIQKALSLGASEYILKPEKKERVIEAIKKVCDNLSKEKKAEESKLKIGKVFQEVIPIIENEIMLSLFLGEPRVGSFKTYCDLQDSAYSGKALGVFNILEKNNFLENERLNEIKIEMQNKVNNFCDFFSKVTNHKIYILFLIPENVKAEGRKKWLLDILEIMIDDMIQKYHFNVTIGISSIYDEFEKMNMAYKESSIALYSSEKNKVSFYTIDIPKKNNISLFKEHQENIVLYLKGKNFDKFKEMTESILLKKEVHTIDFAIMKSQVVDLLIYLQTEINQDTYYDYKTMSYKEVVDEITKITTAESLCEWLCNVVKKTMIDQKLSDSSVLNSYVFQAIQYINQNFNEDISLDMIAEEIDISSFYLSRLFKQEIHKNFVQYLTDIRMKKAMEILKQGIVPIKDIGKMVGYSNQTYFYKVFKKYTGITIGEMRDEMRKSD